MEDWTPATSLQAIKKGYLRVNMPILWSKLRKYCMKEGSSRILKGLQGETECNIKGKRGNSDEW